MIEQRLLALIDDLTTWLLDGSWADEEVDDFTVDLIVDPAIALICKHLGHVPVQDHCGRPEHDLCSRCQTLLPGKAHK